jgi:hypothetical protein
MKKRTKSEIKSEVYKLTPYARNGIKLALLALDVVESEWSDADLDDLDEDELIMIGHYKDWMSGRTNEKPSDGFGPDMFVMRDLTAQIEIAEWVSLRAIADAAKESMKVRGSKRNKALKKALDEYQKLLGKHAWAPLFD